MLSYDEASSEPGTSNEKSMKKENGEGGFIFIASEQKTDAFFSVKVIKQISYNKKSACKIKRMEIGVTVLLLLLRDCKLG